MGYFTRNPLFSDGYRYRSAIMTVQHDRSNQLSSMGNFLDSRGSDQTVYFQAGLNPCWQQTLLNRFADYVARMLCVLIRITFVWSFPWVPITYALKANDACHLLSRSAKFLPRTTYMTGFEMTKGIIWEDFLSHFLNFQITILFFLIFIWPVLHTFDLE